MIKIILPLFQLEALIAKDGRDAEIQVFIGLYIVLLFEDISKVKYELVLNNLILYRRLFLRFLISYLDVLVGTKLLWPWHKRHIISPLTVQRKRIFYFFH